MIPQFITGPAGQLFSIYFPVLDKKRKKQTVLFFPPFAEEMNKSRRMVALQARRFAKNGFPVLLIDLYGTGDSEGDFRQANWDIWQQDMLAAINWLQQQGDSQFIFWGQRLGALLLFNILNSLKRVHVTQIILWQPVLNGEVTMTQFLRLRLAADMINQNERITIRNLRDTLRKGEIVEVAGYGLHPSLVNSVDQQELISLIKNESPPIHWFEVLPVEGRSIAVTKKQIIENLLSSGISINIETVIGEPFWSTVEIAQISILLNRTTSCVIQ